MRFLQRLHPVLRTLLGLALGLGLLGATLQLMILPGAHASPLPLRENGVLLTAEESGVAHREIAEITAAANLRDGSLDTLRPSSGIGKEFLALMRKAEQTNEEFYRGFNLDKFRHPSRLVGFTGRKQSQQDIERARRALAKFNETYRREEEDLQQWYEKSTGQSDPEGTEKARLLWEKWSERANEVLDRASALIAFCDRHWPVRHEDSFTFEDASQYGVFVDLSKEFDDAWTDWDKASEELDQLAESLAREWMDAAR